MDDKFCYDAFTKFGFLTMEVQDGPLTSSTIKLR
jgi:hypothetical protein